jgi:hypothetical protein
MRPLYETSADLNNESAIAEFLQTAWNCKFVKLPIRYHLDFVAVRGDKAVAYAELKSRSYSMKEIDRMGGYLMSIGKWSAAKQLCEASMLPFVLIVKAADGLYSATFTQFSPDDVLVRGRTDRNDWQDIEPCVLLNTNKFKRIEEWKMI